MAKTRFLMTVDFNNNDVLFPVHHGNVIKHWSLIHLHWTGDVWQVIYVDSAFDQSAGDRFCNALLDVIGVYLTKNRQLFLVANVARKYKRVMFARDAAVMALKSSADFVRVLVQNNKQSDGFNCGCFMLHYIECVANKVSNPGICAVSTTYFRSYRKRLLMIMFCWDG